MIENKERQKCMYIKSAPVYHALYIHFYTVITLHFIILIITILTQLLEQNPEAAAEDVLKSFANFTENHLCWSLYFTKLQVFRQ